MADDIRTRALKLYRLPFYYQHGYIFDSNNEMVADKAGAALRVRGWGRISYMDEPEKLIDEVGAMIAVALTRGWKELLDVDKSRATSARGKGTER